jgi:hypothetical protein
VKTTLLYYKHMAIEAESLEPLAIDGFVSLYKDGVRLLTARVSGTAVEMPEAPRAICPAPGALALQLSFAKNTEPEQAVRALVRATWEMDPRQVLRTRLVKSAATLETGDE